MQRIHLGALFWLVLGIIGCAETGSGSPFVLRQAKPDEAIVYHYRTYAYAGSGISYDVIANKRAVTRMGGVGFFEQSLAPGPITYRTKATRHGVVGIVVIAIENALATFDEAYSFHAEPGKVYFLRWKSRLFGNVPEITPVPEADALDDLSKLNSFPPAQER